MRVVQDLKAKGVHPEVIGKAVGETYGEIDEQKLACEFAERKRLVQPKDQKAAARTFRMMARAGFSSRVIMKMLRNWNVEDEPSPPSSRSARWPNRCPRARTNRETAVAARVVAGRRTSLCRRS